jgi:phosphoribosylformylglycinamidine synthase subunit PurQ / glutaminase
MKPSILILHASGANRDGEAARACELAGGCPEFVHINQLRRGDYRLQDYQALLLPGGFTYGDALSAGARLALDLRVFFEDQLLAFVDAGKHVLGICNGFQTLVKAGVLPGAGFAGSSADWTARPVTLTENAGGHFECRWIYLAPDRRAAVPYLADLDERIFCPVAHGEGNFQARDYGVIRQLEDHRCIAFRYVTASGNPADGTYPANPNGSIADIAGICNPAGNVLGLMPHPEDHLLPIQHPQRRDDQHGLVLFQALVRALR